MHAANAIVIVRRHFLELREVAVATAAYGIRQIFADRAGGVGEPCGKQRGFGIEQQACGFASAGGNNDGAGVDALFRARSFVNVRYAGGLAVFIHENFASHRAGNHRELPGFHRGRNEDLAGAEI